MANPIDRGDSGIVYYGSTKATLPTYTDINGSLRTAVRLVTGIETFMPTLVETAFFHVGGVQRFSLQCEATLGTGRSVVVRLRGELAAAVVNENSPLLATFRNDTATTAASHTLSSTGKVLLQTAHLGEVLTGAISAAVDYSATADVDILVRLRVER
jgi:hypothetical protein